MIARLLAALRRLRRRPEPERPRWSSWHGVPTRALEAADLEDFGASRKLTYWEQRARRRREVRW